MAKESAEGLKKILINEEEGLNEEAQGKVEEPLSHRDPDAQRLDDGFRFFKNNIFDKYPECFRELAEAQHPKFLVFACSDSRVSPTTILNFKPGEAFVCRNIANMVPPFDKLRHTGTGAVIEYAVKALEVQNILIIGHSRCGGIKRLMTLPDDCSHSDTYDFIDDWVKIGLPAKIKVLEKDEDLSCEEKLKLCETESVKNSMENLMTYPYVRNAVENGTMTLRGGYYDFVHGTFEQWIKPTV